MPPSPNSFLADGSGRTLIGGVAVAGTEAGPGESDGALANTVAEDDDICAVWVAYSSCPLRSTLVLSLSPASKAKDSANLSGWFSLFGSSFLRSSSSTLPARAIPVGAWETVGSRTGRACERAPSCRLRLRPTRRCRPDGPGMPGTHSSRATGNPLVPGPFLVAGTPGGV
jgi:hypothetical protein